MKFTAETKSLSEACRAVQRAISGKSNISALAGIMIRAVPGALELTGYDLEVGIQTRIEATVQEEGATVLNAKLLCEILRKLPADRLEISSNSSHTASITAGESKYRINGMSADDYPALPSIEGIAPLPLPLQTLKSMIRQTAYAASVDLGMGAKPIHMGVKFELTPGELCLAAIDGFRLAMRKEKIDYQGDALEFVVPPKALAELLKMNGGDATSSAEDANVSVVIGSRHIIFSVGDYRMVSRLLEGQFMNYHAAIPKAFKTEAVANVRELIEAIERISLINTEKVKAPIRCNIKPSEKILDFNCATGVGTARDSVAANISGEVFEVGFNNRFLLDALRVCDTDQVKMHFNGAVQPVTILPLEGESFLFMVLPVRLQGGSA